MSITIGLPVYNAAKFLKPAINSILNQSFSDWELIIVDDGSDDESLEIARSFVDPRITVISDGKNKKLPFRLNQIVSLAKYDFIARMDADDLISPERLRKQYDLIINQSDIDLVSTGVVSFNSDGKVFGVRYTKSLYKPTLTDVLEGKSGIVHASVLGKRDWFIRNPYDENCLLAEDYKLWLNAFLKNDFNVAYCEDPLYFYREDQNITYNKLKIGYLSQIKIMFTMFGTIPILNLIYVLLKYIAKIFIIQFIFITKQQKLLHRRRVTFTSKNSVYQELLDKMNT